MKKLLKHIELLYKQKREKKNMGKYQSKWNRINKKIGIDKIHKLSATKNTPYFYFTVLWN